ncbi:MAG TPA: hypothetical protein VGF93_02040, partial [Solirubrobacteraceae bacterium]
MSLFLAVPGVAQAATVTTTADSGAGSLRDAIANASDGQTIDFAPALNGQTITLTTGGLLVTHSLTISGPGAGNLTINGGNNGSVFEVVIPAAMPPASTSATISGLTITGGNVRDGGGGGISAVTVDTVTLTGDTISGNQAPIRTNFESGGGGVNINGGKLVISNSTISNNGVTFNADARNSGGGGV